MTPVRIQRKRTKGWRMPPGARYVGRPTIWGNPYRIGSWDNGGSSPAEAAEAYRFWLANKLRDRPTMLDALRDATALACWCPLDAKWCHADILIELLGQP